MADHFVNGNSITPPYPEGMEKAVFGMGCFWGPERLFWQTPGSRGGLGKWRLLFLFPFNWPNGDELLLSLSPLRDHKKRER